MDSLRSIEVSSSGFSAEEYSRYSRQMILSEIGSEGQYRLRNAAVLCIGAGGLGSPIMLYLAAAGVGHIGIVDSDIVEGSNLHRQVIYGSSNTGQPKTHSARDRLQDLNPNCSIKVHNTILDTSNALKIIADYDIICDATDNFPSRYLINDACVILGKPDIYGSVQGFHGQASVFNLSTESPNFRDLLPAPPPLNLVPSCAEAGVLGVLPGLVGTIQATEALKVITGIGKPLDGRLLLVDGRTMQFREMRLRPDPDRVPITSLVNYDQLYKDQLDNICKHDRGSTLDSIDSISVQDLKLILDNDDLDILLLDVRRQEEAAIATIKGARLIPLANIENSEAIEQVRDLARGKRVYVHCKLGGRSAKAVRILAQHGIVAVNVSGGIDAWSREIDTTIPQY
ncbi:molybdopterin-synthase adenylyltransferase MoeB [cyanobiont of Ornithocercus magnificus]|nr:molybdopterin-synthase adenylyltransferase MoeB [cyanobiont of Ornithocercus magnificus]